MYIFVPVLSRLPEEGRDGLLGGPEMRLSMLKAEKGCLPPPPPTGRGDGCGEPGINGELLSPLLPSESVLSRCSVLSRRFLAGEPLADSNSRRNRLRGDTKSRSRSIMGEPADGPISIRTRASGSGEDMMTAAEDFNRPPPSVWVRSGSDFTRATVGVMGRERTGTDRVSAVTVRVSAFT